MNWSELVIIDRRGDLFVHVYEAYLAAGFSSGESLEMAAAAIDGAPDAVWEDS